MKVQVTLRVHTSQNVLAAKFAYNYRLSIIKSALIVTDNSKTSNSRARVASMGAKTTVTMPYYARIVLEYI